MEDVQNVNYVCRCGAFVQQGATHDCPWDAPELSAAQNLLIWVAIVVLVVPVLVLALAVAGIDCIIGCRHIDCSCQD
jgi:hypothetical protein